MEWEDYIYPSGVLRNKLNIDNFEILSQKEFLISSLLNFKIMVDPIKGNLDFDMLKKIHQSLFEPLYSWAGKLREVEMRKSIDEPFFTSVSLIKQKAVKIFYSLQRARYFINDPKEKFIIHCSELLASLNDLHPFREGNGRANKTFLNYIAIANGYIFNYKKVDEETWTIASATAHRLCLNNLLIKVLSDCIENVEDKNQIEKYRKSFNI